MFATAEYSKGHITLWKNMHKVKTKKIFVKSSPIMKFKNGEIVATAYEDKVYVLNAKLKIKQEFDKHEEGPRSIDFDDNHIVIGYYGCMVDLYNRNTKERKEVIIIFKTNLTSI